MVDCCKGKESLQCNKIKTHEHKLATRSNALHGELKVTNDSQHFQVSKNDMSCVLNTVDNQQSSLELKGKACDERKDTTPQLWHRRDSFSSCSSDSAVYCSSRHTQANSSAIEVQNVSNKNANNKRHRHSSGSSVVSNTSDGSNKELYTSNVDVLDCLQPPSCSNSKRTFSEVCENYTVVSEINSQSTISYSPTKNSNQTKVETVVKQKTVSYSCNTIQQSKPFFEPTTHNLRRKIRKKTCNCDCNSTHKSFIVRRFTQIQQATTIKHCPKLKLTKSLPGESFLKQKAPVDKNYCSNSKTHRPCRKRRSEVDKLYDALHEMDWAKHISPDNILSQIDFRRAATVSVYSKTTSKAQPKTAGTALEKQNKPDCLHLQGEKGKKLIPRNLVQHQKCGKDNVPLVTSTSNKRYGITTRRKNYANDWLKNRRKNNLNLKNTMLSNKSAAVQDNFPKSLPNDINIQKFQSSNENQKVSGCINKDILPDSCLQDKSHSVEKNSAEGTHDLICKNSSSKCLKELDFCKNSANSEQNESACHNISANDNILKEKSFSEQSSTVLCNNSETLSSRVQVTEKASDQLVSTTAICSLNSANKLLSDSTPLSEVNHTDDATKIFSETHNSELSQHQKNSLAFPVSNCLDSVNNSGRKGCEYFEKETIPSEISDIEMQKPNKCVKVSNATESISKKRDTSLLCGNKLTEGQVFMSDDHSSSEEQVFSLNKDGSSDGVMSVLNGINLATKKTAVLKENISIEGEKSVLEKNSIENGVIHDDKDLAVSRTSSLSNSISSKDLILKKKSATDDEIPVLTENIPFEGHSSEDNPPILERYGVPDLGYEIGNSLLLDSGLGEVEIVIQSNDNMAEISNFESARKDSVQKCSANFHYTSANGNSATSGIENSHVECLQNHSEIRRTKRLRNVICDKVNRTNAFHNTCSHITGKKIFRKYFNHKGKRDKLKITSDELMPEFSQQSESSATCESFEDSKFNNVKQNISNVENQTVSSDAFVETANVSAVNSCASFSADYNKKQTCASYKKRNFHKYNKSFSIHGQEQQVTQSSVQVASLQTSDSQHIEENSCSQMQLVHYKTEYKRQRNVSKENEATLFQKEVLPIESSKKPKVDEAILRMSFGFTFHYKGLTVNKNDSYTQVILKPTKGQNIYLSVEALTELKDTLNSASSDSKCQVLILNGMGNTFCSGLDLKPLIGPRKKIASKEMAVAVKEFVEALAAFHKPLVSVVNGSATGLGVTLLTYSDVVLASDAAVFHMPYTQLGYMPEGAATLTLPQVVGATVAMDMLLRGRKITAQQALDYGLVSEVLKASCLPQELVSRVRVLAENPISAMETTKAMLKMHLLQKLSLTLENEVVILPKQWLSQSCQMALKEAFENKLLES